MIKDKADYLLHLRKIYDEGAFLVRATKNKTPIRALKQKVLVEDEEGDVVYIEDAEGRTIAKTEERLTRCDWPDIARHVRSGGLVLYYAPGNQGLMILDFDPMLPERLDSIESLLGCQAHRQFESSGKHKPAAGNRPAGKGGHAAFRIDPASSEEWKPIRQFAVEPGGESYGEAFTFHPGFGVIVWNSKALADTMELDIAEAADPRLLHQAKTELASKDADGNWVAGDGSRHDAAISEIGSAAIKCTTEASFTETMAQIEEKFKAAFGENERDYVKEWARLEAHGWELHRKDRAKAEEAAQRTAAIAPAKEQAPGSEAPASDGASEPEGLFFEESKPNFTEMKDLFSKVYKARIRFNVRSFDDEYLTEGAAEWQTVTDRVMCNWVKVAGLTCTRAVSKPAKGPVIVKADIRSRIGFEQDFSIWFSENADVVDPFLVWIEERCSQWDGTPRLDKWMRSAGMEITNGVEDYVKWVSRFMFLAPLQRAYEPGCELQQMPVLWGPRGTGKSSAIEYTMPLNSLGHRQWWSDDFRLITDSKQMIEMTEGFAIMEWSELRGLKRTEPEEVKSNISGKFYRARKAYAKRSESVPRRYVLVGTTNNATLQADPALMRRIVALHVGDGSHVGKIRGYMDDHREQLFAEARVMYQQGIRAEIDHRLEDGLDVNNSGAVWRNWTVIENIQETVNEIGTTFSKMDFCVANDIIRPEWDVKQCRKERDKWWRENGSRYLKSLGDLGFVEVREDGKRVFTLEDDTMYREITGSQPY